MKNKVVLLLFTLVAAFILCGAASAATLKNSHTNIVKIKHSGTPTYDQWEPKIDGTRVVWTQTDASGKWTIYYKNLAVGKTIKIKQSSNYISFIDISGTRIVWEEDAGPEINIFYKNVATGTSGKVCPSKSAQYFPAISGTRIVWEQDGVIYFKNIATNSFGRVFKSKESQSFPDISGTRIVWEQWDKNDNTSVYYKNIATGKAAKIASVGINSEPKMIGRNMVLWVLHKINGGTYTFPTYDTTVYLKNLATGKTVKLFRSSHYNSNFGISGNRMVFEQSIKIDVPNDEPLEKKTVYVKNLKTGSTGRVLLSTKNQESPVISGNMVLWNQELSSGHYHIYYKNLLTKKVGLLTP